MGINRLYPQLKTVFQDQKLSYVKNKKVGIDAMGWLYTAYYG